MRTESGREEGWVEEVLDGRDVVNEGDGRRVLQGFPCPCPSQHSTPED